jgi:hypothetical protein
MVFPLNLHLSGIFQPTTFGLITRFLDDLVAFVATSELGVD